MNEIYMNQYQAFKCYVEKVRRTKICTVRYHLYKF